MSTARMDERTRLNRALAAWLLVTLFFLPLYPKVGLVAVSGTYIPVRADDVLIGILGLGWVASLILGRRRPALPERIATLAGLWIAVTFVALLVGAFVLGSIGLITGFAYWAKPIEYLLLGWICYDLVRNQILSVRAILGAVFSAAAIVVGYGLAEHFALAPRLPGQSTAPGVPISTIGDLHELAAYLGIVGLLGVALWHRLITSFRRAVALIGLALLVAVMYYTGARSEFVALGLCLLGLAVWRPSRLPALVGIAALVVLFATPLVADLLPSPSGSSNQPPAVSDPRGNGPGNVTDRFFGDSFAYSFNERFNIKWRAYIEKTMRSPIVGLGPSAATEAADGYYMRSFVESGIVGLLTFIALIGAVFVSVWRAARHGTGLGRALAVGMVASTVFVALVSVLIDTWVASRVMELYWPLIGTTLAVWALRTATNESPVKASEPVSVTSASGA